MGTIYFFLAPCCCRLRGKGICSKQEGGQLSDFTTHPTHVSGALCMQSCTT